MITGQVRYGAIENGHGIDDADGKTVIDADVPVDRGRIHVFGFVVMLTLVVISVVLFVSPDSDAAIAKDRNIMPLLSSSGSHRPNHHLKHGQDPNEPLFYHKQLVDHFGVDGEGLDSYWSHRYYLSKKYFGGPGSPIFLIVGGEGGLDHGMLYPFVTEVLAKRFNAAVVQPEHRFYGQSKPSMKPSIEQLLQLLTPQQVMADMLRLVTVHLRESEFQQCSEHRSSSKYCPLITVGASYPGFLSALFRLVYPDRVDAAYASAAPLLMYAQRSNPNAYYDIVTAAANKVSPGCAQAVKRTLLDVLATVKAAPSLRDAAIRVGLCEESVPPSIKSTHALGKTVVDMVSYSFSEYDMDCYPPGPDTGFYKVCQIFQDPSHTTQTAMEAFFKARIRQRVEDEKGCSFASVHCDPTELEEIVRAEMDGRNCLNFVKEFPDESDVVVDLPFVPTDGNTMWNFQTCTNVIFLASFSESSMFPAKNATYEDLADWCNDNFGVTPRPRELADLWGFDDLVNRGASRILFTGGGNDMWSGGSIVENLSSDLLALNFENGAHHSDLTHVGPSDRDTPDIREGFIEIADILGQWIDEIKAENEYDKK